MNSKIPWEKMVKYLGIMMDQKSTCKNHNMDNELTILKPIYIPKLTYALRIADNSKPGSKKENPNGNKKPPE